MCRLAFQQTYVNQLNAEIEEKTLSVDRWWRYIRKSLVNIIITTIAHYL